MQEKISKSVKAVDKKMLSFLTLSETRLEFNKKESSNLLKSVIKFTFMDFSLISVQKLLVIV